MNLAEELRKVFVDLDKYESETEGTWDWGVRKCRDKEISLLTADMDETIRFMDTECTADEYAWISEVFEDVAEITQSGRFIEAIHRLADKYPEVTEEYKLFTFIEGAEDMIWDDDEEASESNGA